MEKTTHAKIEINEDGETTVRQLSIVSEYQPGRQSLVRVDVSQAIEAIDRAALKRDIEAAYTGPRDVVIQQTPPAASITPPGGSDDSGASA